MTLEEWIHKEGITERDVAKRFGISQQTLNRAKHPRLGAVAWVALLIEERTNGEVPAWTSIPVRERARIYGETKRPEMKP
jgi:transcriptional regulator with XRE-family HTH domain